MGNGGVDDDDGDDGDDGEQRLGAEARVVSRDGH